MSFSTLSVILYLVFFQSLTLLHYLLKNGSERVVSNARDRLFEMRTLESYKFIDEKGKDQGLNGMIYFIFDFEKNYNLIFIFLRNLYEHMS